MAHHEDTRNIKKAIWGIFLIALGVLFLLEHSGSGASQASAIGGPSSWS